MRKLKLQMQLSVDGFVAGPNHEMDWMVWDWSDDLNNCVSGITEPVDTILLGRKLAEGFVDTWLALENDPQTATDFVRKMNNTPKMVFSNTLQSTNWKNTTVANGNFVTQIEALKNQEGGDIIVYGGASFVASLINQNLIDDLYLFINPTALGNGLPIFTNRTNLTLIEAKPFDCGIVLLHYQPNK